MSLFHEFSETHWSQVFSAGRADTPCSRQALEALCQRYWGPLYFYARRRGRTREEAEDLTQEFFQQLIEKHWLETADPERGRFRNFLLRAMENFINKEWAKSRRQKRGGGCRMIALDADTMEARLALDEAAATGTPEHAFEVKWAETVLALARERIVQEYGTHAMGVELLMKYLAGERGAPAFAAGAESAGVTEAALKSAVHRLRGRFGQLVREEVARTVADPAEVEDEMRQLLSVLGG